MSIIYDRFKTKEDNLHNLERRGGGGEERQKEPEVDTPLAREKDAKRAKVGKNTAA